jgi:hypothetical protein
VKDERRNCAAMGISLVFLHTHGNDDGIPFSLTSRVTHKLIITSFFLLSYTPLLLFRVNALALSLSVSASFVCTTPHRNPQNITYPRCDLQRTISEHWPTPRLPWTTDLISCTHTPQNFLLIWSHTHNAHTRTHINTFVVTTSLL